MIQKIKCFFNFHKWQVYDYSGSKSIVGCIHCDKFKTIKHKL